MILAILKNSPPVRVDAVINRGEWFGKYWLVSVQMGFEAATALVEADSEQDAIDELADSPRSHWIDSECECPPDGQCECCCAGNDSHPVDLDNVRIDKVHRVEWFAKKPD